MRRQLTTVILTVLGFFAALRCCSQGSDPITKLPVQNTEVRSIAFSPDGSAVVTVGIKGHESEMIVWRTADAVQIHAASTKEFVNSVASSNNGMHLASCGKKTLFWDFDSDKQFKPPPRWATEGEGTCVAFSPDGSEVAVGELRKGKSYVNIYDAASGKVLRAFRPQNDGSVACIAYSADGKWLATGSESGAIRVWKKTADDPVYELKHGSAGIKAVALSPDIKAVAAFSGERKEIKDKGIIVISGEVMLWETATARARQIIPAVSDATLAFDATGRTLTTASNGTIVGLTSGIIVGRWDVLSAMEKETAHISDVPRRVAISADCKKLAFCTEESTIKLWDLTKLQFRKGQ